MKAPLILIGAELRKHWINLVKCVLDLSSCRRLGEYNFTAVGLWQKCLHQRQKHVGHNLGMTKKTISISCSRRHARSSRAA